MIDLRDERDRRHLMGCAIIMTVMFTAGPLLLLRGCEALDVSFDTRKHLARVTSPDGQWTVEVERDGGMDGDAQHEAYVTDNRAPDAERRRLANAGDQRSHDVLVTWSADSTVMAVWLDREVGLVHDVKGRRPIPPGLIPHLPGVNRERTLAALLRQGYDVDDLRDRPLHAAAARGDLSGCVTLLDAGADVNGRSHMGATPLIVAVRGRQRAVATMLLAHGADRALVDASGRTAHTWAALAQDRAMVQVVRKPEEGLAAKPRDVPR